MKNSGAGEGNRGKLVGGGREKGGEDFALPSGFHSLPTALQRVLPGFNLSAGVKGGEGRRGGTGRASPFLHSLYGSPSFLSSSSSSSLPLLVGYQSRKYAPQKGRRATHANTGGRREPPLFVSKLFFLSENEWEVLGIYLDVVWRREFSDVAEANFFSPSPSPASWRHSDLWRI